MRSATPATRSLLIALGLFIVVTAVILFLEARGYPHAPLVQESGLVEQASALLWFLSAAVFLIPRGRSPLDRFSLGYLAAISGLRELDANKRIFEWNLSKMVNLVKPELPLIERTGAILLIFIPILLAVSILLIRWAPRFTDAWRSGAAWSRFAAYWVVLAVAALIADKLSWPIRALGIELSSFPARAIEESLELGLVVFTLLCSLAFFVRSENSGERFA
ncbi:MAG: hypothetical protein KY459_11640 [Acidobacteria bacterium]|nr:hypothetical protein [Acidobacteriota bacterium]